MSIGKIIDPIVSFFKYITVGALMFVAYYFGAKKGSRDKNKAEGELLDAELELQLEKNAHELDRSLNRDAESVLRDAIREGQRIRDEIKRRGD